MRTAQMSVLLLLSACGSSGEIWISITVDTGGCADFIPGVHLSGSAGAARLCLESEPSSVPIFGTETVCTEQGPKPTELDVLSSAQDRAAVSFSDRLRVEEGGDLSISFDVELLKRGVTFIEASSGDSKKRVPLSVIEPQRFDLEWVIYP